MRVYDVGKTEDGRSCIAKKRLEGQTLEAAGRQPPAEAQRVGGGRAGVRCAAADLDAEGCDELVVVDGATGEVEVSSLVSRVRWGP